jgi:hypothetical protein
MYLPLPALFQRGFLVMEKLLRPQFVSQYQGEPGMPE